MKTTDARYERLKANYRDYSRALATCHEAFGGPSIYFHQRALTEGRKKLLSDKHLEMIYATLAAWGMHRMGKTHTKMVSFEIFKKSVYSVKADLEKLRHVSLEDHEAVSDQLLSELTDICFRLQVSVSKSRVVGNSKALAHILPALAPPIDRQYTIRFFCDKLQNFQDIEEERRLYAHILRKCHEFCLIIRKDPTILIDSQFNSSLPKIFDNLVMVYLKSNGA